MLGLESCGRAGHQLDDAVTADGAVWCWGENGEGQLGNGSRVNSLVRVRVPLL
jgi:hypothetical protein